MHSKRGDLPERRVFLFYPPYRSDRFDLAHALSTHFQRIFPAGTEQNLPPAVSIPDSGCSAGFSSDTQPGGFRFSGIRF
jgi:hypothetical protein